MLKVLIGQRRFWPSLWSSGAHTHTHAYTHTHACLEYMNPQPCVCMCIYVVVPSVLIWVGACFVGWWWKLLEMYKPFIQTPWTKWSRFPLPSNKKGITELLCWQAQHQAFTNLYCHGYRAVILSFWLVEYSEPENFPVQCIFPSCVNTWKSILWNILYSSDSSEVFLLAVKL